MKKQIYILIFIFCSTVALSQFSMPNTEMRRGERTKLSISYEDVLFDSNAFNFKLKFDLNMIDIISVVIEEKVPNGFGYEYEVVYDQRQSFIEFQGSSSLSGFFAEIEIEALAGPDSVTYFRIDSLNNLPYQFENQINTIIIPDPIFTSLDNVIGEPFPNPFVTSFKVNVSLLESASLSARMFNSGARLVAIDDNFAGVTIQLLDDAQNIIEFGELEDGEYQIRVEVDRNFFSNGYYYLGIKLGDEVIYKPIIMAN